MEKLLRVTLLLILKQCLADVHSLHRHCVATLGTSFPKNIQFLMIDDIMVYYYISDQKESSIPKWLNHSKGVLLWDEIRSNLKYNRFIMDSAIKLTSKRFNHSHEHFYQAYGQCEWNKGDKHVSASMGHAYNGKDFVSFNVTSSTWVAAVPEAVFYKRKREENTEDLQRLIISYKYRCFDWLKQLLHFSEEERKEKVPDVVLIEKSIPGSFDKLVTCHVTGFYPRKVQVEWLNQDGHVLDGVSREEVLANFDGTYQVRRTLNVPEGAEWSQVYKCVVIHTSVTGNITVSWDPKKSLFSPVTIGFLTLLIAVALLALIVYIRKRN